MISKLPPPTAKAMPKLAAPAAKAASASKPAAKPAASHMAGISPRPALRHDTISFAGHKKH